MLEEDPDAPIGLLWAEQDGRGVHVNISGGGVTATPTTSTSPSSSSSGWPPTGQTTLVADNHEYPANPAVEAEPLIRDTFGTDFKRDQLRADVLGSLNADAVRAMDTAELRVATAMDELRRVRPAGVGRRARSSSAVLATVPIAMLASSVLRPNTRRVAPAVGHPPPRPDRHDASR